MTDTSPQPNSVIGETTYRRFVRMINSLPDGERENFTSSIIHQFATLHEMELRDILPLVYERYRGRANG